MKGKEIPLELPGKNNKIGALSHLSSPCNPIYQQQGTKNEKESLLSNV